MKSIFLKTTAGIGLLSVSALALAAGNCCGDLAACCLHMLSCCF